jgi:hypothetical protein
VPPSGVLRCEPLHLFSIEKDREGQATISIKEMARNRFAMMICMGQKEEQREIVLTATPERSVI